MSGELVFETEASSARPQRPKVSVCIPAFQAKSHLQSTIDSVLAQSYPDLEIVVVDNNSSDGTRDILEAIDDDQVQIVRNATTLPIADNWNRAVRESNGEYVKLLCADDVLEPDCVASQVAVLEGSRDIAVVSARVNFIDDNGSLLRRARGLGRIVGRHSGERVVRQIVRSGSYPINPAVAVMFRRVDFDRCGGFCGDLVFPMDIDLWVRLLRDGDFFGVSRTLASFRMWSGSISASTSASSQFAQQTEFVRGLVDDPRWNISTTDRILGRVNSCDMQLRRTVLYAMSNFRGWQQRRKRSYASSVHQRAMTSVAGST